MANVQEIFKSLESIINLDPEESKNKVQKNPLGHVNKIIMLINSLSDILEKDETILISIKHRKLIRTSFQIIIAMGTSQSLIKGVGVPLEKRSEYAKQLINYDMNDDQKYQMLVLCADFFTKSFTIPVLKSIICTFYLSDYLATLIQLAFAPIKKPGTYSNYTMTKTRYDQLILDRRKYVAIYENLVQNCYQPILMKELLVLQGVTDPQPPKFVWLTVRKEMSRRLIAPGGLLSLIHCFLENYGPDTGHDWKKIDTICKIVAAEHGILPDAEFVENMCSQITQILTLNNTHYILTASACSFSLYEKYKDCKAVKSTTEALFLKFNYNHLLNRAEKQTDPILMTNQEIEHNLTILYISLCVAKSNWPPEMWIDNMYVLFLLGIDGKALEWIDKIRSIIVKCLESNVRNILNNVKMLLFGLDNNVNITTDVNDTGIILKYSQECLPYSNSNVIKFFLEVFKQCTCANTIKGIFQSCLKLAVDLMSKRSQNLNTVKDVKAIVEVDEKCVIILQLLSEISTDPNILELIKNDPAIVLEFIDYFIIETSDSPNEECSLIALVLLNTVLANVKTKDLHSRFDKLLPFLTNMQKNNSDYVRILCDEAIDMISKDRISTPTHLSKAIKDLSDNLLPVRAHGIMEITKLIENKDIETLAKKHYIFCLMQEQLKDTDTYIYLAAINCMAALGTHCCEEVLATLCNEFYIDPNKHGEMQTRESINKSIEDRLKVGDIIVKVIKKLGNKAVEHKTILLNTMLNACGDPEPMIRTSALSNLAEIALVINYKIGKILKEVLRCVWSVLESDNAIECRRAAVMVISSLIKGLGQETLLKLKGNLLPVYRTLKNLYDDPNEDPILKLHAQIGLEELNSIVAAILFNKIDVGNKLVIEDKIA